MTLKEAREAAINRLPILCDGLRYERIGLVGMKYSDINNEETPSILLIDKLGRWVWANPRRCEVAADGMDK
jgi:hypothetical protein